MARITWQNVDAPDISSALARAAGSVDGLSEGLGGIADIFKGIEQRKRAQAERDGMARLLGIQSVEDFDAATRNGGIYGALGTPSDMVSSAMLEAIAGRRDQLEQDRTSDLDHTKATYAHGRSILGDQRSDAVYDRGEADRLRQEAANQWAHEQVQSGQVLSPESLRRDAVMDTSDAKLAEARLAAAAGRESSPGFQVPADLQIPLEVAQALEVTQTELGARNRDLDYAWSTPDKAPARLWFDAKDRPTERGAAFDSLASNLQIGVDTSDPEVASKVGRSLGAVETVFREYTDAGIPANIVAAAMENNLRGSNWLYRNLMGDGSLTIDKAGLDKDLERFRTQSGRAEMETLGQQYEREKSALAADAASYERLYQQYQLALANNSPQAASLAQKLLDFPSRYRTPSDDPKEDDATTEPPKTTGGTGKEDLAEEPLSQGHEEEVDPATQLDPVVEGARNAWSQIGQWGLTGFDHAAGMGASVPLTLGAGAQWLIGSGIGLVAPEYGSGIVQSGRDMWADSADAAGNGLGIRRALDAYDRRAADKPRVPTDLNGLTDSPVHPQVKEALEVLNDPSSNPVDRMMAEAIVKRWQEAQMGNGE